MNEAEYWTEQEVGAALDVLRSGGLILVKGDIGYGLFGTTEAAIRKMYEAKGRAFANPCIVIGNLNVLDDLVELPSAESRSWIESVVSWSTLAVVGVAKTSNPLLQSLDPWLFDQTVTQGTIAIFLRTGPFIAELVNRAYSQGWIFVGSSANRSSEGNCYRYDDLPPEIVNVADLAVDHGRSALENEERLATTIVNFSNWSIRREGVNAERIKAEFLILQNRYFCGVDSGDG